MDDLYAAWLRLRREWREQRAELSRLRAELAEARRDRDRCRLWIHGKVQYLRGLDNKWGYTLTGDGPLYQTAREAIDAAMQPEAKEGQLRK